MLLVVLNMFVFVDSVVFILFLSLSCLESCFSATFRETLLQSSGLMMGEVSLETSPKNIMIQDMINSKTVLLVVPPIKIFNGKIE